MFFSKETYSDQIIRLIEHSSKREEDKSDNFAYPSGAHVQFSSLETNEHWFSIDDNFRCWPSEHRFKNVQESSSQTYAFKLRSNISEES